MKSDDDDRQLLTPAEVAARLRARREARENADFAHTLQRFWSSARRKPTIEAERAIQDIRRGGRR